MAKYYISTGAKNGRYTLRRNITVRSGNRLRFGEHFYTRSEYICSLYTRDIETAIVRACAKTGLPASAFSRAAAELDADDRRDGGTMPFGQYKGQKVAEIIATRPEYFAWSIDCAFQRGGWRAKKWGKYSQKQTRELRELPSVIAWRKVAVLYRRKTKRSERNYVTTWRALHSLFAGIVKAAA